MIPALFHLLDDVDAVQLLNGHRLVLVGQIFLFQAVLAGEQGKHDIPLVAEFLAHLEGWLESLATGQCCAMLSGELRGELTEISTIEFVNKQCDSRFVDVP